MSEALSESPVTLPAGLRSQLAGICWNLNGHRQLAQVGGILGGDGLLAGGLPCGDESKDAQEI